jgi:Holliday junction resolvase RusA-like endonuclease
MLEWSQKIVTQQFGKVYGIKILYYLKSNARDIDGSIKLLLDMISGVIGCNDNQFRWLDSDKMVVGREGITGMRVWLYTSVDRVE